MDHNDVDLSHTTNHGRVIYQVMEAYNKGILEAIDMKPTSVNNHRTLSNSEVF